MKKRKGSLLQRMMAVLLSAVLIMGMVWDAAPMTVLANEDTGSFEDTGSEYQDSVSGNDAGTVEGDIEPEGETEPAEKTPEPETVSGNDAESGTVIGSDAADEENGNLQALLAQIAALPEAAEYLGAEPDMDGGEAEEAAYEQWLAGLYAHAEEALAIQEAVEGLSEEEQAAIPEEALTKLAAWVELAQTAGERAQVMMVAETHKHPVCGTSCKHSDEVHPDVEWIPLTQDSITAKTGPNMYSKDCYILDAGNYYLTEDISIDKILNISGETSLCFNGHTIKSSLKGISTSDSSLQAYKFNTCDCGSGGGFISEGEYLLAGTGYAKLNLYGGNFVGKNTVYLYTDTLTLDGATLGATGAAVNIQSLGTAFIKSGSATSSGSRTVEIYTNNTTGFTMSGGTVTNTSSSGRALSFSSDTVGIITGGTIIAQGSSGKGVTISGGASVTLSGSPAISGGRGDIGVGKNSKIKADNLTSRYVIGYDYPETITEAAPVAFTVIAPDDYSTYFAASETLGKSGLALRKTGASSDEQTVEIYRPHKLTYCAEVPATCTADGKGEYWECTNKDCGKLFSDAEGKTEITNIPVNSALGHNKDGSVVHKDATCTEAGVKGGIYCTRCNNGKAEAETALPATGHAYSWSITKEPTMTAGGTAEGTCSNNSSHKETRALPFLTDTTVWTVGAKVEPTQNTDGSQTYTSQYGTVTVTFPSYAKTDFVQFKEAVSKGGTVMITQDIILTETVIVEKDVTIVSDGSHTIHRGEKCNDSMFTVSGGTLTLGGGSGTLILDGGAVWSGEADATLNRGKNNTGINANASIIRGNGGNIVLKENTVLQNNRCTSEGYGGAVTLHGSSLRIEGAKICGNKSSDGGGAVKTYKDSSVVMTGGEICHNEAGTHGGAFQIYGSESGIQAGYSEVSCKISGGSIHNNLASRVGGGIAVSNHAAVELSGSVIISSNKTTDGSRRGGGVGFIDEDTSLTVAEQVQIKDNLCGDKINNVAVGIYENNLITISGSNPLSGSASIGITTINMPTKEKPVNITGANGAGYSRYFTSDDQQYTVADSADHTVKLTLPKSDFDKLVEVMEIVKAALDDYTATNDTTQQSIQEVIDAALNDVGIADAKVEVRDFHKTEATTEAEGSIQAKIYVECGTENNTASMTAKIDKVKPHTHTLTLTPAKDATCTANGNTEYYVCGGDGGCGKWFSDAAGTQEITDHDSVMIAKMAHEYDKTAWGYKGADGHAHKCRNCDAHDAVQAHTLGGAATAETPQTCTVCSYIVAPATGTEPGTGTESGTGTQPGTGTVAPEVRPVMGTIVPEVRPGENVPVTDISTPAAELKDMLLTEEEKQMLQNGTDVRIILEVQDAGNTVSSTDRSGIRRASGGYAMGQYLNIDLYKLVGESRTDITETAQKLRIVIAVPEGLKNTGGRARTFAVVRVHNGSAELLPDLDSSPDTITIETDRFSTYAIVYKNTSGGAPARDGEPKTGDETHLELYATLAMIAGFAYLLLYVTDPERGMTEERKQELVSRLVSWAKRGGMLRRCLALAAIFVLLVYYHGTKKLCRGAGEKSGPGLERV